MTGLKNSASSELNDSCKNVTDLILNYLTDQLSPKLRVEFERHLKICPDCVNFLNTYRKTVAQTKSLAATKIPPKVHKNLLAFLRQKWLAVSAVFYCLIAQGVG